MSNGFSKSGVITKDNTIVDTIRETIRQKNVYDDFERKSAHEQRSSSKHVSFHKVDIKLCMNWKEAMSEEEKGEYWYQISDLNRFEELYQQEIKQKIENQKRQQEIKEQQQKKAPQLTKRRSGLKKGTTSAMSAFARSFGIGEQKHKRALARQKEEEAKHKLAMSPEQMSKKALKELKFFLEHNKWVDMETLQSRPFTKVKMTPNDTRAARVLIANHFKRTPTHWKKEEEERLQKMGTNNNENSEKQEEEIEMEESDISLTNSLVKMSVSNKKELDLNNGHNDEEREDDDGDPTRGSEEDDDLSHSLLIKHLSKNKSWYQ